MSRLTEQQRHTITSSLEAVGATLACPRCGQSEFTVLDGYIMEHAQSQTRNLVFSGDNRVTCVAAVCGRCGYLAQHLMDVLS
jgi:ribosomal protein S27AE